MPRVSILMPVCASKAPEAEARNLVEDSCNEEVISHLGSDALRRLSKIEAFQRRSRSGKLALLPAAIADSDMRNYLSRRIRLRAGRLNPSRWSKSGLLRDASNLCLGQGV